MVHILSNTLLQAMFPKVVQSNIAIIEFIVHDTRPIIAFKLSDLDLLIEWCKVWQMDFNHGIRKCKYLCLGLNFFQLGNMYM